MALERRCLNCQKRKAEFQPIVGYTYCKVCLNRQRKLPKLDETIELAPESMKEDRKKYQAEIVQPFRSGQLSKEYVKQNPGSIKKMIAEGNTTREEVKNAKNIWDHNYYKESD